MNKLEAIELGCNLRVVGRGLWLRMNSDTKGKKKDGT
jgi:hypothetical protein